MQSSQTNTDIDQVSLSELETWSGQWRTVYAQRRKLHEVDISQILYGQIFTIFVAMIAGLYLQQNSSALLLVGTTLVLYPVLSDMLATNAAVLTAGLHHELESQQKTSALWLACLANLGSLFVTILSSLLVSILTACVGLLLFDTSFVHTVLLGSLAGVLAALAGFPIMTAITFFVRAQKHNPDNITAPLDTTVFSSLTLLAIIVASKVIPW